MPRIDLPKAIAYNQAEFEAGRFTPRMVVELVAAWQATHDLDVDGMCGPATQASLNNLVSPPPPPQWPPWPGPLPHQPRDRTEVYRTFGDPGTGQPNSSWEKDSIATFRDLPGVPSRWYFQCHRMVEPYLREGLRRARLSAPDYEIERAAGYVFRHQRHDPRRPLSYHAWGIAIDIDPQRNYSRRFAPGTAPVAWSPNWNEIWPNGLPQPFVQAMQSCGWTWGADWDEDGDTTDHTFVDPMHFEWIDRS